MDNFDKTLNELGAFGWWQILAFTWIGIFFLESGIDTLLNTLTGFEPSIFMCHMAECGPETEYSSLMANMSLFGTKADGSTDYCVHRPLTKSLGNQSEKCTLDSFDFSLAPTLPSCTKVGSEVTYGPFAMANTFVTEFGLICGDQYKIALLGSVYLSANLVAYYPAGLIADAFGRRKACGLALLLFGSCLLAGAFMPNYESYVVSRFICAIGNAALYNVAFTMSVELVPEKYVVPVGILLGTPYSIGVIIAGLTPILGVTSWRHLHIYFGVPVILSVLLLRFLPESPRWQVATGRYIEAEKCLRKVAKLNGVEFKKESIFPFEDDEESVEVEDQNAPLPSIGPMAIITNKTMRMNTLVFSINWMVISLAYYVLSFSSVDLSEDPFVAFILSATADLPSYLVIWGLLKVAGRRTLTSLSLVFGGAAVTIAALISDPLAKLILSLFGKFCVMCAYAVIYLYTAETFPTAVRTQGMGVCTTMSTAGSILAPMVALYLPAVTGESVPLIIMGVSVSVGGVLTIFLLPETSGKPLPETIQDVELLPTFWDRCGSRTVNQHIE